MNKKEIDRAIKVAKAYMQKNLEKEAVNFKPATSKPLAIEQYIFYIVEDKDLDNEPQMREYLAKSDQNLAIVDAMHEADTNIEYQDSFQLGLAASVRMIIDLDSGKIVDRLYFQ